MKRISFTTKLTIKFTVIVVLPVIIFIIVGTKLLQKREIDKVITNAQQKVHSYCASIEYSKDLFYRIRSTVAGDMDLTRFLDPGNDADMQEIMQKVLALSSQLERDLFIMPQVYGIRIFAANNRIPERWPVIFREKRLAVEHRQKWLFNYRAEFLGNLEQLEYPAVAFTTELFSHKRHVGYVQITMKMRNLFPFLYPESPSDIRDYVFYKDALVYGNQSPTSDHVFDLPIMENIKKKAVDAFPVCSGTETVRIGHVSRVFVWERIPSFDLLIIHLCDTDSTRYMILFFRYAGICIIVMIAALMYFIIRLTTDHMMMRLNLIMDGLRKIQHGDLSVTVPVVGSDEIAETAAAFNKTTADLRDLIERIKQEQKLVTETEVKAMQNQINAHFLYNVLETIKMQAELADQEDIVQSITLLGKMMHYCLHWRVTNVTLSEELDYIRSYIAILNIRNDYKITLAVDVPQKYMKCMILKMLLQPIVENAFFHGIEPLGTDALLEITTEKKGNILWIEIRDYGKGMDSQELKKIKQYVHADIELDRKKIGKIGLRNIQERLHVFYGKEFSLKITSMSGEGTCVSIPVPYGNNRKSDDTDTSR